MHGFASVGPRRRWMIGLAMAALIVGTAVGYATVRHERPGEKVAAAGRQAAPHHRRRIVARPALADRDVGRSAVRSQSASASPLPSVATAGPCGRRSHQTVRYRHVVWIWMENKGYRDVIGNPAAPFESTLARDCGVEANYFSITHPSVPNYLAATSGATNVRGDPLPTGHIPYASSLFGQVAAAGLTWREYQESMAIPCGHHGNHLYTTLLNTALYYAMPPAVCEANDVPFAPAFATDVARGQLPAFSLVVPNLCDDTHRALVDRDCSVSHGDAWLHAWVTRILDGPNYRAGNTLLVIVWDEDRIWSQADNIPLIVIAPQVRPGTVATARYNQYGLLRMTEDLLYLRPLGAASKEPGMAAAFGV